MSEPNITITCPVCGAKAKTTHGPETVPKDWFCRVTRLTGRPFTERFCSEKCLKEGRQP